MLYTTTTRLPALPIRIVIGDDHAIFRKGFQLQISQLPGMKLVGQEENGVKLIEEVTAKKPDIVVTDIHMPDMCGIEATKILRQQFPATGVIALSMFGGEEMVLHMLEARAKGYLLKNTDAHEVTHAIQTVYNKGIYYCSTASNKLVRLMAWSSFNPFHAGKKPDFTDPEIQIIRLICQEFCSKEIAAQIGTNHRSVESTRERIQEKIGARNMVGIVVSAIRHGIFCID